MPHVSFSDLRLRLLLLVLIAVTPALVLMFITASDQRQKALADAEVNAVQVARLASREQERLVVDTQRLLSAPSKASVVRQPDAVGCSALFADLLRQNPIYANLGATDPDGDAFCSGVPLTQPVNTADRAWFQRAVQTATFAVGDYEIDRITGQAVLVFGQPVLDDAGRSQAVVFAVVPLTWLNILANVAQLPEDWTVTLFDQGGTILAHYPNPEKWVGLYPSFDPVVKAILDNPGEGTVTAPDLEGTPRVFGFLPLRGTLQAGNVYVSVGIPKELVLAEANGILKRNLAWLGLAAALAMAVAWVGGELLIRRKLVILSNSALRIANGDLSARALLPDDHGELGQLGRAFDHMAEALEMWEADTKQAQEKLEQRVREVTALNGIFQRQNSEYFTMMERYRQLLTELERNPQDLDDIIRQARATPFPNMEDIPGIRPDDNAGNPDR